MAYNETQKLQYEVEKLIEEIRVLQKPLTQPNSWLAIIGLFISVVLNVSQCSSSKNDSLLADIKLQQAKLDFKEITLKNDSLKKVSDSLTVAENVLASNTQTLNEAYQARRKQVDSIEAKINQIKEALVNLQQTLPVADSTSSSGSTEAVAIGEIKRSLSSISAINQSVVSSNFFVRNAAKNLPLARQKEREGFENLIAGNYDAAIAAFTASENAYNGYDMVYDLAKLIKDNKPALSSQPGKRNELLRLILSQYSYGAPKDIIGQLKAAIQ